MLGTVRQQRQTLGALTAFGATGATVCGLFGMDGVWLALPLSFLLITFAATVALYYWGEGPHPEDYWTSNGRPPKRRPVDFGVVNADLGCTGSRLTTMLGEPNQAYVDHETLHRFWGLGPSRVGAETDRFDIVRALWVAIGDEPPDNFRMWLPKGILLGKSTLGEAVLLLDAQPVGTGRLVGENHAFFKVHVRAGPEGSQWIRLGVSHSLDKGSEEIGDHLLDRKLSYFGVSYERWPASDDMEPGSFRKAWPSIGLLRRPLGGEPDVDLREAAIRAIREADSFRQVRLSHELTVAARELRDEMRGQRADEVEAALRDRLQQRVPGLEPDAAILRQLAEAIETGTLDD